MFTIIPAIDLLDGKVVRLKQGSYADVTEFDYTPSDLAKLYEDNGATHIHLVDLNGAKEGTLINKDAILSIRKAVSCTLDLGGGIRSFSEASSLFELGLDLLVLGSLLVKDFELSSQIISRYPQQIIAGLDLKDNQLAIHGWLQKSALNLEDLLQKLHALPVHSIICTHIEKDGMMQGPNVEGLLDLCQHTSIPVIASGGVSSLSDIDELKQHEHLGISGCVVGKAFLSGALPFSCLKS